MFFINTSAAALHEAIEKRRYATAYALLRGQTELWSWCDAQMCLKQALYCTPKLFRRVLEKCEPGEYREQVRVKLPGGHSALVHGTILTLAAALDRPEHVRLLLEAGYDCNSAGMASAAAFAEGFPSQNFLALEGALPFDDHCGIGGSQVTIYGKQRWNIQCATPLAAAVACGSRRAAAVLLRWPGVWKAESGVVCRAAVSALQMFREDPRQAVVGQVFGKLGGRAFDAGRLLKTCNLQVEYSGDFCPPDTLRVQLENGFCDESGARRLLQLLKGPSYGRMSIRACFQKMLLMEQYFPKLCRESWVTGILLRELTGRYSPQRPCRRMVKQWKRLCGEEGDLTWARSEMLRMPQKHLDALLKELGQDIRLVMDADAFGNFFWDGKGSMMVLLRYVHLRHNRGLEGVSALSDILVQNGDLRLLRKAAQLGAFRGEDPKELLAYLDRENRKELRAMVLAYGGTGTGEEPPPWKVESRCGLWCRSWTPEPAAYEEWLRELVFEELPEEECLRRLQMMGYASHLQEFWFDGQNIHLGMEDYPDRKALCVKRPEAAVFCGTQEQPLRLLMEYMPEKLKNRYSLSFSGSLPDLEGTPLCLAAATGRTNLVKLLLASGIHPDEQGCGMVSAVRQRGFPLQHLTPVMAAILYGEEETARLLLDAGAECDFSRLEFQKILRLCNEEALALAVRLPDVGFEAIPPERLAELQKEKLF